ncbi:Telomere length regulator protein (Rif1), putative [Penicillium digitatum]|uniref:Telomere length regulator protein (Rif1), putative n=3 Tax=Penicillium digitatum TaxID=36651 RepID=K9FLQ0_PEND2|nr:Telomere length regulator protein (Rif1), putative [Penicillium digitatum Pd1]EKV07658.1 Telomere length regulator protein (Rif1), putative [Penicillium digitatum Pd1]EKV09212.1 Telomere length regulator protein (Rif1), putative [Penicillium digitatum PHI26]QQK41306.1 Telomere length regulator protein (Rif1), putative [Penicillium digitatum]
MVEILSARPPTPPRTASRIVIENTESPLAVQTPKESPFSTLGPGEAGTSSRSSKKVNFSPWPKYIKPPTFASAMRSAPDFKTIPPSPNSKPTKSILKATQSPIPVWSPNVDTFTTESLAMLLESVIQQLAGESMSSRLDAYMQFFGALRTYYGIPAGQKIAEKLSLITEFIQRDVNRDLANGSPLDTNLANQALKLSAAFVWHPEISTQISEEFKIFLVDHSITCLYEAKAPKSVLTHYMTILSTQNFGPKIMTGARVARLLTVLQEVAKSISGNAIVSHRLNIYQRLLGQAKTAFISQSSLWIEHLIFGLLHHMKDTRSKAIALGFQVAIEAGPNPALSKNIRDLFDRPLEHDRKLVSEVRERMTRMMATVDSGEHVPQIWSIIILLLRGKRCKLEDWDHFKEWVLVVQKCFNCSEPVIKSQAILGWNRFVFAVSPNESTSRYILTMLGKPVLSQFDRKRTDKSGSPPTQLALTSYYNLLYYTFRPSASYQYLDIIWEEYVAIPSSGIFSTVPVLSNCLSRILANLLWSTQVKIWIENRIHDATKMEAEELPAADSRWVRSRIASILKVFEHILKASVWIDDAVSQSHVALAWNSLSNALSLASSKEITPSGESTQAVASVWSLLQRLWTAGPPSLNAETTDIFFERFRFLSTTMIVSIGGIPFTEKLLLRNANETDNVSTHLPPNTTQESAILHLLRIISSTAGTIAPSQFYTHLVLGNIEAACNGRFSRGSRIELLQQCAELSTTKTSAISRAVQLSEVIWNATAQAAADALQSFPMESARERDGSVSRDYENVIKILSFGLFFPSAFQAWSHLLETFVRVVRTEKGNQAVTTMIVDPMAERLMHLSAGDTYLPSTSLLGHSLSIPFMQGTGLGIDRSGIQAAGHAIYPHKLLASIAQTLHGAYDNFNSSQSHGLPDFIEALTSFLGTGVPQFQCQILQCLQSSLGLWLKDESHKIHVDHGVDSRTLTACRALSSATINVLQTSVSHDLPSLKNFAPILCAGLESSHVSTAKRYVELWGSTFGLQSFVPPAAILQAVQSAESRAQTAALPPQDGDQDTEMLSPLSPQDKVNRSLHQPSQDTQLSSPVIRTEDSSVVLKATEQFHEPQLPSNLQNPMDARIVDEISVSHKRKSHREIFSMIESIQSSSPASASRKLGFDTPPHLRKIHGESLTELPLTPTLAPTENEEGFIGSSPTPGTRDPTPAMNSGALISSHLASDVSIDPPSSPPEMQSRSPSPQKSRSKSARRRAAKARKALVSASGKQSTVNSPATSHLATEDMDKPIGDAHDYSNENSDKTPRANGITPSRRLRSGLGKDSDTAEPSIVPLLDSDKTPVQQPSRRIKSSSSSKKKRKQAQSTPADNQSQQASYMPSSVLPDSVMDSSEETETQIASQLGQDLELAVDLDDRDHLKHAKHPDEPSMKKRKRDQEESPLSVRTDRRRSMRLSTVKDAVNAESMQPEYSHSQDATSRPVSLSKSLSPTATRRSTRSSQRKDYDSALADSIPRTQDSVARESTQDAETPRPSKRSRKSIRLKEQSVSTALDSTPQSVPRDTRSCKTRSQQHASEVSQHQPSGIPSEEHGDTDHLPPQVGLGMVPESLTTEDQAEQNASLVSVEEATATQGTEMEQATEPAVKPDIDTDSVQQPGGMVEQTTSVATMGTQTQETFPEPKLNINEKDIAQSLKNLLSEIKTTTLSPSVFREVDDYLFKLRCEAQDASTRHNTSA